MPEKLNNENTHPVPVVSAIIERQRAYGQVEILIQTRWKLKKDPKYSGVLEIPAGTIKMNENIYDALRREVYEETGLRVINFRPNVHTNTHEQHGDDSFAFVPYCCQQQTHQLNRLGFVFLCSVEEGKPVAAKDETKDPHWVTREELKKLLEKSPERFFTFQLGALDYYINAEKGTGPLVP